MSQISETRRQFITALRESIGGLDDTQAMNNEIVEICRTLAILESIQEIVSVARKQLVQKWEEELRK